MDGVIIDSFEAWFAALNASLAAFDLPAMTRETFRKQYWGRDQTYVLEHLNLDRVGSFCIAVFGE
jgi:phosphoglycolate phosphatase-like HAD superfamily hydrolase